MKTRKNKNELTVSMSGSPLSVWLKNIFNQNVYGKIIEKSLATNGMASVGNVSPENVRAIIV